MTIFWAVIIALAIVDVLVIVGANKNRKGKQ